MEQNEGKEQTTRIERDSTARRADESPQIYVASLADYNAGRLHGAWIDAAQPVARIREEIQRMLEASTEPFCEEWAIHDYAGFGGLKLSEYEPLDELAEAAYLIGRFGEVFAALLNHFGGLTQLAEAREAMQYRYLGEFDSLRDYAHDAMKDLCGSALETLPPVIEWCIDWEKVADELEMGGDVFSLEVNYRVHVFSGA